jgi:branched-chain amino acid transport system ATP-binding protein
MLAIEGLSVSYGGLAALSGVSLNVDEGQFVAIVGPNGAGKTTLFKAVSGTVRPVGGRVAFEGRDLLAVPPAERAHLGIAHVPEGRQVFAAMTVLENLEMGAYAARGRADWQRNLDRILTLFPVLAERRRQLAGTLSGGEQQMVAIGRALMSRPKLLLMDEPSAGLAPLVVAQVFDLVRRIRAEGLTVLIVEQNVQQVLDVVDRAYLLETGSIKLAGAAGELKGNDFIRRAYMGL